MRNRDLVRSFVDTFAVQGERGLRAFHVALLGAKWQAFDRVATPSGKLLTAFGREAATLVQTMAGGAASKLEADQRTLLAIAGLESTIGVDLAFDQVRLLVRAQYERDARLMRLHVSKVSLAAHRRMLVLGESGLTALEAADREMKEHFRFTYRDRLGRRWDSGRYMRVMLRGHLVDAVNWAEMESLANRGIRKAVVYRPGHPDHGKEFSLVAGEQNLPSYEDLRRDVFHPNSLALVDEAV